MTAKVAVLGGGIAGLTVADELSRRGYRVHLYEGDPAVLGGKARSYPYAAPGREDLPAEHGFRFFPGFYRNVIETMAGIEARTGVGTVADRLVTAEELALWTSTSTTGPHRRSITWENKLGSTVQGLTAAVEALCNGDLPASAPRPFSLTDMMYLVQLLGVVALADRHKLLELDGYSFADYTCNVFAQRTVIKPSPQLQAFLRGTGTRLLVAAQPEQMSARTGLVTLLRLLNPKELYTERGDRMLPGPTNREWIDPWVADLSKVSAHRPRKVTFHRGRRIAHIELNGTRAVSFTDDAGVLVDDFDHLVCGLPHSVVRQVVGDPLPAPLEGLQQLVDGWMVGVQFYLRESPKLCRGHSVHVDSPWALTSIHQAGFWDDFRWADAGDGKAVDVLSVCVSDFDTPAGAPLAKRARDCTRAELLDEVWRQLCATVNAGPGPDLLPADRTAIVVDETIDEAITFGPGGVVAGNASPLYVNSVGSWAHRPPADIGFDNFFLAGDYVRTNADLATMESANESAKRAVAAVLAADGFVGSPIKIIDIDHLGLLGRDGMSGTQQSVRKILDVCDEPLVDVAEIPERFQELLALLPEDDGIRAFCDVHEEMSRAVSEHHAESGFLDQEGLARMDIRLVERFLQNLALSERDPDAINKAWDPLFACRHKTDRIHPIQFAIAGIHSHVASDLLWAILRTHEDMGYGDPELESDLHKDYCAVNSIEGKLRDGVEARLGGPLYREWDERLGPFDDFIRSWSFARARDKAWIDAMVTSRLPGPLATLSCGAIDRATGLANRLFLR